MKRIIALALVLVLLTGSIGGCYLEINGRDRDERHEREHEEHHEERR